MTVCPPPALPEEHILKLDIIGWRTVTLICTAEALTELIVGYLYNEDVILSPADIAEIRISEDLRTAAVRLNRTPPSIGGEVRPSGLGGTQLSTAPPITPRAVMRRFSGACIQNCAAQMENLSVKYAATGGVHASALFDGTGMLSFYEDIGRHNTLDKLAGDCLLRGLNTSDTLLVTTGRISSDMVRKAARIGASAIASFSTPTDLACRTACDANMTLFGYIRKKPLRVWGVSARFAG